MGINSSSSAPVQRDKVERQRTADDGDMDETRRLRVTEISRREIEEIDDEQNFRDPEVASDPQHDEAEEHEIAGDEVRADVGGGRHVDAVGGV